MSAPRHTLREVPVISRVSPLSKLPFEAKSLVLAYSDTYALASLYRDPAWRPAVEEELAKALKRTFSRFTQDPSSFQSMMRRTGSVISGSTALYHILRSPPNWQPGDVDLLTPNTRFADVVNFITSLPGAHIENEFAHHYNPYAGDDSSDTGFTHIVQVRTPVCKFDVIRSSTQSPYHPISYYYGTHVMNAITSDMTICAYPSLTLRNISVLTNPRNDVHTANTCKAIDKYCERGFTFRTSAKTTVSRAMLCKGAIACPNRDRVFGDHYCLVLPNGNLPVDKTLDFLDDTLTTAWKLGGTPCMTDQCFVKVVPTSHTMRVGKVRKIAFAN